MKLVEDTNIAEQTNFVDDSGATIPEDAQHLFERRLKIEDDSYVLQPGENDVNTVTNWIQYFKYLGKDYLYMLKEIRAIRAATGYANFSDDEKKLLQQNFSASGGIEFNDLTFYDTDEWSRMYECYEQKLEKSFHDRDRAAFRYLRTQIYKGVITEAQAGEIGIAIIEIRESYLMNFIMGSLYNSGLNGITDFINNTGEFQAENVADVDQGAKEFRIDGVNLKRKRKVMKTIQIINSTGNDGFYTVSDVRKSGANSFIEVDETIPSAVVDGQIIYSGLKAFDGVNDTIRDTALGIYLNGE